MGNDGETWCAVVWEELPAQFETECCFPIGPYFQSWIGHVRVQVDLYIYLVPEHLRSKIDDWLCGCVIRSSVVCLWHLAEERGRAVIWSPPGGELDQVLVGDRHVVKVRVWLKPLSAGSLTPTSETVSHASWGEIGDMDSEQLPPHWRVWTWSTLS